jgi:hypothetical protein
MGVTAVYHQLPVLTITRREQLAPAAVVINEALTNSPSPFEDAVEFHNPYGLQREHRRLVAQRRRLEPAESTRSPPAPRSRRASFSSLTRNQFNTGVNAFSLSSLGDELYLSAVDGGGALTGFRAQVRFGAAEENVSFGRVLTGNPAGSAAPSFGRKSPDLRPG